MGYKYDILGVDLTKEQYDKFILERANGKELKLINNEIVAVEKPEDKQLELINLQKELNKLSQDIIQMYCGAVFDDKEERLERFRVAHNRYREIVGKEPRIYSTGEE